MNTYWVTIGFDNAPSPTDYTVDIADAIDHYGRLVTTMATIGEWAGEQDHGIAYLVTIDTPNVPLLRDRLAAIAAQHRQEAIGFVGGPGSDTLVWATDHKGKD